MRQTSRGMKLLGGRGERGWGGVGGKLCAVHTGAKQYRVGRRYMLLPWLAVPAVRHADGGRLACAGCLKVHIQVSWALGLSSSTLPATVEHVEHV